MLTLFDRKLKAIYYEHKDEKNPKVPLKTIKKYLELEGIKLDDEDHLFRKIILVYSNSIAEMDKLFYLLVAYLNVDGLV